jgi:hypothetical protein
LVRNFGRQKLGCEGILDGRNLDVKEFWTAETWVQRNFGQQKIILMHPI